MTVWSTIAVEMIHPLMDDIQTKSSWWMDCGRCHRAFSSVMAANLTFFQTAIAGDSWGLIAIPVIEEHLWASFVFVGSSFTLVIGILNLIIAVLVDSSAEARSKDTTARAQEAHFLEQQEKRRLGKMFRKIDVDDSGSVSLDELQLAAVNVPEFEENLRVMDIQGDDLDELFRMLDEDNSGEIDPAEFIEKFYRLKCGDIKTASTFVKHYVVHLKRNQDQMNRIVESIEGKLGELERASLNVNVASTGTPRFLEKEEDDASSDFDHSFSNVFKLSSKARSEPTSKLNTSLGSTSEAHYTTSESTEVNASVLSKNLSSLPNTNDCNLTGAGESITRLKLPSRDVPQKRPRTPRESEFEEDSKELRVAAEGIANAARPRQADFQSASWEHQLMQANLMSMVDDAEKTLVSSLCQIKASLAATRNQLNSSSHGKSSSSELSNEELVEFLNGLSNSIDAQISTSLRQALLPIRHWNEITEWVGTLEGHTPRESHSHRRPHRTPCRTHNIRSLARDTS